MKHIHHLGIIGGCLNSQEHIPIRKHYHFKLKQLFKESQNNLRLSFIKYKHFSYKKRLDLYIKENNEWPDTVLLQVRPWPFASKARFFNKLHLSIQSYSPFILNPLLSKQTVGQWQDIINQNHSNSGFSGLKENHDYKPKETLLTRLNILLGHLFGLAEKAIDDEVAMVLDLHKNCPSKLIVLGPTYYDKTWLGKKLCQKLSDRLRVELGKRDIPYICYDYAFTPTGDSVVKADKLHLSLEGHDFLGEFLYQELKKELVFYPETESLSSEKLLVKH